MLSPGRTRHSKPRLANAINGALLPFLSAHGFGLEETPGVALRQWRQGAAFVRGHEQGRSVVIVAPAKFGKQLGLNIGRTRDGKIFEWMRWHEQGLTVADLRYSNQAELEAGVSRIIEFLHAHGLKWLQEQ